MEDTDTNYTSGLLVPDVSEDSVDIYDGLDTGFSSSAEKPPSCASQLKDSLDLYEEIVAEEQQNRESSCAQLKSRLQAAQNQIKQLHRRLEQVEMQKTGLILENCCLKKNISALLQTARQEVARKDAEIQWLNQRQMKSRHHRQFHNNQNSSSWTSTGSSSNKPPTSSPLPPPPPSSPPRENQHSRNSHQPSVKESNNSTSQPLGSCAETSASKSSSHSNLKSTSRGDCKIPDKQTEHSVSKCSSSSSTQHSELDKHKSKHREEKYQSHKLSESTDRRHRSNSDPNKDCHDKNRSHKAEKNTGRNFDSRSSKSRAYLNVEGRHRSDRVKSPPPVILHSAASSDGTKGRSREWRQNKAKLLSSDLEHSATQISKESYSRDHRKLKTSDRHSRSSDSKDRTKSSSSQHAERYSDSSKVREGERLSKDYQRKEQRQREDEINRKHKGSRLSEMSRGCGKERSKESGQGEVNVQSKDKQEKTSKTLKRSSKEQKTTEKSSVEENTPHKKLCFMETLNLTISPIKKPVLSTGISQDALTPVDRSDDKSHARMEDMCVIREVDTIELESGLEDVTEQCPDTHEDLSTEKTDKRCDNAEDVHEKDKNCKENSSGKLLELSSVHTTSVPTQPLDNAENQMTVYPTSKSPWNISLKTTEGDILKNHKDSTKLSSESKAEDYGQPEAIDGVSDTYGSVSKERTSNSLPKVNNTDRSVTVTKSVVLDSVVELSKHSVQQSHTADSSEEGAAASSSRSPPVLPPNCQQGLYPFASCSSTHKKDACDMQDVPKDTDTVSSTINLELLPRDGLSLPQAIYILTQTSEDASDSITAEPSSSTGCIGVSKVSSTTEETVLPEKYSDLTFTPKKSFSPGKIHENNVEPSSSVPVFLDEDSMMHTLSNLKRFPDAISPLRSPVRIIKRSHVNVHCKPGYVKSLQNDLSDIAIDVNSKKLDVNKENKYPGSPTDHNMQNMMDKVSDLPSSLSDTELEEGEILSESNETAADSPVPATKRVKLARPVRIKPSPKFSDFPLKTERLVAPNESSETPGTSTSSPKTRLKIVCPPATKASFSNIEDIMETFKLVRTEIRKKYMKLHKTFPKKSFFGMMDKFQASFLEFVDGAHFGQICSQAGELKSRLRKQIVSVFSKVSNNGIVKRIFEQQAIDLKQKLWDFVDVHVDYLFRDIHVTLKSLCKPARLQAEDMKPSGNEKVSRQFSVDKPQCQQKETQSPPTGLNRIKPGAVMPYKTGLGSRGKDIRITHGEKTRNVDPHPTQWPNTLTVANLLPPKNIPSTPEKDNLSSLVVSQNGTLLDKSDFEILTEQQASSLTFNLVRDSQMGEIFKCLLQGCDLLETSGIAGDSAARALSTPRKDQERLISITTPAKFDSPSKLLSPTKFGTPSKHITAWSSISPRRMSSPQSKDQILPNSALFDESCLLEVPSDNRAMLQCKLASERSYSILAEDLAVSLTIPSPLKSDSHLSFLQPSSMQMMSAPDSVISAHISEDALLDEDDATEQDIHLALDTDNSSCGSSSSVASVALATSFVFQPDRPTQVLVMEKSNDHFVLKIRQASASADTTITADENSNQTLREEDVAIQGIQEQAFSLDKSQNCSASSSAVPSGNSLSDHAKDSGICQAKTGSDICLTRDESLTLTNDPSHKKEDTSTQQSTSKLDFPEELKKLSESLKSLPETPSLHSGAQSSDHLVMQISQPVCQATAGEGVTDPVAESINHSCLIKENINTQISPSKAFLSEPQKLISPSENALSASNPQHFSESSETNQRSQTSLTHFSSSEQDGLDVLESERSPTIAEDINGTPETEQRDCDKGRKRKKHLDKSNAKRSKKEEVESTEGMVSNVNTDCNKSKSVPSSLSPSSLSAKNVVRKKGEVVIAWTRDEDRTILTDLKTKGASRETFSALSEKLHKPSGQIAHRFYQLMKLFKKQEKMDT
uniref:CASP8-associated protein 2 n=1 Tax=Monopterus albus TaxID=43700 RepID=UPI0009B49B31|nr:CASP8-associated protein 2 [Monopterus albus]